MQPFPRQIHYRYVRAYVEALEGDGDVSDRAIAKALGCDRTALWRWRTRYPAFREWVAEQIDKLAGEKGSAVVMRCANLGLRGSVQHAELYLKATRRLGPTEDAAARPMSVLNIAIPRPDGQAPLLVQHKVG